MNILMERLKTITSSIYHKQKSPLLMEASIIM